MSTVFAQKVSSTRESQLVKYEELVTSGVCVRCKQMPALLGRVRCQDCTTKGNTMKRLRAAGVTITPEAVAVASTVFEYGPGLPAGHPNRGIEWNPGSWDWRTGTAPSVSAVAS